MLWTRIYTSQTASLRAGPLTLDRANRRATIKGKRLELSPLLFRLAEHLAEQPGTIVTRADLKRALWPYAERIDTERRLNTAMRALRAALGDDAEAPRLIETVRSHGYRWIGNRPARRPWMAAAFAAVAACSLSLAPEAKSPPDDLTATLNAQNAMEQWRRDPTAATAHRASALTAQARIAAPSALVMKAELELGSQWRWADAERDYARALEIEPTNSDARLGLAWLRADQARQGEALALVRDILNDGVISGDRRASLGWLLIRAGRPDLAAATCGNDATASINDLSCSHQALAALGRYAEAKSAAIQLMEHSNAAPAAIARVQQLAPRLGYAAFLQWRAAHFLPADAPWFQKAEVLADAGSSNEALAALTRSVTTREAMAVKIASTPSFEPMRGDPRFEALVRAVGV